jgi:hypothetical protein
VSCLAAKVKIGKAPTNVTAKARWSRKGTDQPGYHSARQDSEAATPISGRGLFSMKEDLKLVKIAFVAFSVLVLPTPWLCGQNPDELLVVRLPAKHGRINQPGAAPIPFPTVRGEIAASGRARRCGSMAAGRSSVGYCDRSPSQAAGEGKPSRHCAGREDKERTRLAPEPRFPSVVSLGNPP